jgi:perosamine synthetase
MIPVNEPLLDGNEKKYLCECIDTKWISSEGPFVRKLEGALAQLTGRKEGVAVANGSVALDLAVTALDLPPGTEVILPTFTIISCAQAVIRAGLTPVPVDCDPQTWNMTPETVAAAITPKTKAIMVVHIYGLPVDMDPILELAREHGLKVIEDAAELIGQTYKGRPCGGFGDISTLSFYPNKHITTGEGGMVLANDPGLIARCRSLRNLCFGPRRFIHEELGWNARMSNLQAALGVAQMERIEEFLQKKRAIGKEYLAGLKNLPGLITPQPSESFAENIYWVFGVVLDESIRRDADWAMQELKKTGIETRPFFWPIHEQPVFRKAGFFQGMRLPHAERLARRGFYLPSGLGLSRSCQDEVIKSMSKIMRNV